VRREDDAMREETLEGICAPIAEDLGRVDEFLRREVASRDPFIGELLAHVGRFRGKRIRPALVLLAGRALGRLGAAHVEVGGIVELIHTATLVHDDVLDDAGLRRRSATIHARWGERAAILLGDFLYSRAFALATRVDGAARILSDATHTICEGELLQVSRAHRPDLPEAEYLDIIAKKTGALYAVACRLGAQLAGADGVAEGLARFGERIGIAFQIVDDCLDIAGDEREVGKSLGTDLKKGKVTLPVIRFLARLGDADRRRVEGLLRRPLAGEEERTLAREIIASGTVEDARSEAKAFVEEALAVLAQIGDPALRTPLERLARFIARRRF